MIAFIYWLVNGIKKKLYYFNPPTLGNVIFAWIDNKLNIHSIFHVTLFYTSLREKKTNETAYDYGTEKNNVLFFTVKRDRFDEQITVPNTYLQNNF